MAVPEQLPIVSYVANGATDHFNITFDLSDERFLVVTVNNEIPPVGTFTVQDNDVIFHIMPEAGTIITLARDTDLERETNYSRYDNSFNPAALNWDLDKLWHVLQEQNLVDAKILARIKSEIEWRRTHDFNYDELAQVREKQLFNALKGYTDTILASTNPGVFQGVVAGVVFAQDGKSIQTHLEEILEYLTVSREDIDSKANQQYVDQQLDLKANQATTYSKNEVDVALGTKAVKADTYTKSETNGLVSAVAGGYKGYATLALAQADQASFVPNSIIEVTNDGSNNGKYQWNGTTLTKSTYDPLTQARLYSDTRFGEIVNTPATDLFLSINKINQAYINSSGAQAASTNWSCSGFLPVKYHDVIDYSATTNNLASTIAAYDANKNFLRHLVSLAPNSTLVAKTGSVEIPTDVKFIRVSYYSANNTAYSFMYKPFQVETELLNGNEVSSLVWDGITAKPNLFIPSAVSDNKVLLNNVPTDSGTWFVSDFIPVTPNEYYTTNGTAGGSASAGIHYYDANKTFINYGEKNVAGAPFLIPLGTAFIRINYTKSTSQTIADTVLSQGKVAKKYGPLEDKIIEIAGDNGSRNQKYSGMTLMTMGDSITYGSTTPWTYPSRVAASLGMILNNVGASGTRVRYAFTKTTPESLLEADIITIAYGTNDFKIETPLGVISDTTTPRSLLDDPTYKANESTAGSFYADYKGVIEGIFAANPNARVMLITPIRRTQAAGTGTDTNSRGHKLIDYVNAVKEIAQYYSLPVLDNYNTSGFNQVTMPVWLSDGLHPTEWAQQNVMTPKIAGFIESN